MFPPRATSAPKASQDAETPRIVHSLQDPENTLNQVGNEGIADHSMYGPAACHLTWVEFI